MEIYIVRHGETIWNAKKLLQGRADIELNENGRKLAGITGKVLDSMEFDYIFSSPLIRAYETACLIRGHRDIPIIRDERLRELSFGVYEGEDFSALLKDETNSFHNFFKQPELYVAPEGGETLEHLSARAGEFMQEKIEPLAKECKRVMIVAHGALNKGIMTYVKKHDTSMFWSGGLQKNCNVIIMNYYNGEYNIIEETKVFYE